MLGSSIMDQKNKETFFRKGSQIPIYNLVFFLKGILYRIFPNFICDCN